MNTSNTYSFGNNAENILDILRLGGDNSRIPGRNIILHIDVFPRISNTV